MIVRSGSGRATWGSGFVGALVLVLAGCPEEAKRPIGATCGDDGDCVSGLCYEQICIDPAADDDLDGLTNGFEVGLEADPYSPDSDGDGKPDGVEVPQGLAVDGDGDGRPNIIESAFDDVDGDCSVDEQDADDADGPQGFIDKTCRKVGVCAAATDRITLECGAVGAVATCVYDAVPGWDGEDDDCDGADSDCDGETDEGGCGGAVSSCDDLFLEDPSRETGVFSVDPDGDGPETAVSVECAMGPGEGGWARLRSAWQGVIERQGARWRQYLFVAPSGGWVMSPATREVWSWSRGSAVAGNWFVGGVEGGLSAFWCAGAADETTFGVGCFEPGGAFASGQGVDAAAGSLEVCGAGGGVFGGCGPAGVYVREVRCPSDEGLLMDGELDALAAGEESCWTIQSPDGGGPGLGGNVHADVEGAREGAAPAIRAEPYVASEGMPWLVLLEHAEVPLAAGSSYRLSFWARAAAPRMLLVDVDHTGLGGGGFIEGLFVDETWRRYEVDFVATDTTLDGLVVFYLGLDENGTVLWLDGISLVETGPDACRVSPPELVADGGFSRGLACWERARGTETNLGALERDEDAPSEAPSLRAEQGAAPDGATPYISQADLPLEMGHAYRLDFSAKAATERTLELVVAADNTLSVGLQVERGIGPSWERKSLRFWADPVNGAPGEAILMVLFAQGGESTVWLDDVSLVDLGTDPCVREAGLLADSGFDLGTRCWSVVEAQGTTIEVVTEHDESGSAPYLLARNVAGTAPEVLGVFQPGLGLEVGGYQLRLRAMTDFAPRSIRVRVKASDRQATVLASQVIELGESWQRHTVAFDSPRIDANAVVQIDLGGGSAAYVRLDDVEILKVPR